MNKKQAAAVGGVVGVGAGAVLAGPAGSVALGGAGAAMGRRLGSEPDNAQQANDTARRGNE